MVPLFFLVSPCFRENLIVTWKIVSFFLCIVEIFSSKKWRLFGEKKKKKKRKSYFWPTFQISLSPAKRHKTLSGNISLTYIHIFCSSYWLLAFHICKKIVNNMVSLWLHPWCWFLHLYHFGAFWVGIFLILKPKFGFKFKSDFLI